MQKMSITRLITLMIAIASLATAAFTAFLSDRHAVTSSIEASDHMLMAEADIAARALNHEALTLLNSVTEAASIPVGFDGSTSAEHLERLQKSAAEGAALFTNGAETGKMLFGELPLNKISKDFIEQSLKARGMVHAGFTEDGLGVVVGQTVRSTTGSVKGVLVAYVSAQSLLTPQLSGEDSLIARFGDENLKVTLLTFDGKTVATVGQHINPVEMDLAPVIDASKESRSGTAIVRSISGVEGHAGFAVTNPIGEPMLIVAEHTMDEIMMTVNALRLKQALQILVTVAAIAAIGIYLSGKAFSPLRSVSSAVDQLREGKLGQEVPETHRADVIGGIAKGVAELRKVWLSRDEAQRESDVRANALRVSSVALLMVDNDGIVMEANDTFMAMMSDHPECFDTSEMPEESAEASAVKVQDLMIDSSAVSELISPESDLPATRELVIEDQRIEVRANELLNADGGREGVLLEWEDVGTARLNAGLVKAIDENNATVEFDLQGNVLAANDNFLKTLGYSRDELSSLSHRQLMPKDERDRPEYAKMWEELRCGKQLAGKFRRIAKDGREVWMEAAYNPIVGADGIPYKVVKYATDVTDIESLAFDRKAVLSAIGEAQGVIEFSLSGALLSVNQKLRETLGLRESDTEQAMISDLMDADFVDGSSYREMWQNLAAGKFDSRIYEFSSLRGKRFMQGACTPVFDRHGDVFKVIACITDVTEAELDRQSAEEMRVNNEQRTQNVVDMMRKGLEDLADGDLAVQIDTEFDGEYEQLRVDFNKATERLRNTISAVVSNSDGIRNEASEIARAADDLSRRTENQAATLEETSASLEELTASVKSAAEGAEKANVNVTEARTSAQASGAVVDEAISAMSAIENSSRQISQIIGVIDDIAFQTNLLALNAGVEAARAGDAGRGFAVVASEVRALAQRSSEAAKEIKDLISTSSEQVGTGVELVGRTGAALREILGSVTSISELVGDIANTAKEQSVGIGEINAAVNQIDQVTQQNAAMVEESTAASHSLMQEAEELAKLVAQFRVEASFIETPQPDLNYTTNLPTEVPVATSMPAAASAPTPDPAPVVPAVVGNAALDIDAVSDADDWESF